MDYKKLNILTGWIIFLIASFTYISTIEPTASFWDCGEFIATAYKLQVGHPPGAPLFMIMARVASIGVSPENVPIAVNVMSALASAFTILFLFWSITHMAHKMATRDGAILSMGGMIAVLGSGIVGALAYTWSDSFWFSAVEGEVYALSSFFTAVVFWAILKWESEADQPHSTRWLILIAYLMGLSIGVHLLNLLCIPAIAFVYYFKRYEVTPRGIITTFIVSALILGTVQAVIIPGIVKVADTSIPYPAYVFTGTMLWQVFNEALNAPLVQLNASRNLLSKLNFPRESIILAGVIKVLYSSGIKMLIIAPVLIYFKVFPDMHLLYFPLALLALVLVGTTIGLLLAPIGMIYGDIARMLPILTQVGMYTAPVIFALPTEGVFRTVFMLNFMTPVMLTARAWLTGFASPMPGYFASVVAVSFFLLFFAWVVFRITMPAVIERMSA